MICGKIVLNRMIGSDKLVFRYPKFEDYAELLKNINELVGEGAYLGATKKKSKKEEIEFVTEALKNCESKNSVFLVAEINGCVVGTANIDKKHESEAHTGVFGIALRKKVRGKGIGKLLMETVISEAEKNLKIEIIILEAFAENKTAINLYKKLSLRNLGASKKGSRDGANIQTIF